MSMMNPNGAKFMLRPDGSSSMTLMLAPCSLKKVRTASMPTPRPETCVTAFGGRQPRPKHHVGDDGAGRPLVPREEAVGDTPVIKLVQGHTPAVVGYPQFHALARAGRPDPYHALFRLVTGPAFRAPFDAMIQRVSEDVHQRALQGLRKARIDRELAALEFHRGRGLVQLLGQRGQGIGRTRDDASEVDKAQTIDAALEQLQAIVRAGIERHHQGAQLAAAARGPRRRPEWSEDPAPCPFAPEYLRSPPHIARSRIRPRSSSAFSCARSHGARAILSQPIVCLFGRMRGIRDMRKFEHPRIAFDGMHGAK